MAGPAPQTVIFQRFDGGDVGRARPLKTVLNQFRALNIWTYPSGAIGPRPPWQDCGFTGMPQKYLLTFDVQRTISGVFEGPAKVVLATDNGGSVSQIYVGSTVPGSALASAGTGTGTVLASEAWGNSRYFCVGDTSNGISVDLNTNAVASVAGMPAGGSLALLGTRMVISNPGVPPVLGQIRFSADADPTSWPVGNFINVGGLSAVTALFSLRNALVICQYNGTIWQITGVLTETLTAAILRQVDVTYPPLLNLFAPGAVVGQSNLWYCAGRQMVKFTGAQALTVERPDLPVTDANKLLYTWDPNLTHPGGVLPLPDDDEFIVVGGLDKISDSQIHTGWAQVFRARDNWTRHTIPVVFRDNLVAARPSAEVTPIRVGRVAPYGVAYICTSAAATGTSSRPSIVYRLNTQQEFPHMPVGMALAGGVISSTLSDADSGAPVVGQFSTSEVWAEDQQYVRPPGTLLGSDTWAGGFTQIRVRSVEIDLSFNGAITPASTYNKFTLSVTSVQRDSVNGEALATSSPQAYVAPATTAPSPDGDGMVRARVKFQCGEQGWGSGFRVNLNDWVGISVHRISCVVDLDGPRY